ncbi:glyoxalase [Agromyces rhizosphaerae]|uniref:Glyoxalase n=1 Tax=Agromyces rhizosphaerae TaxID=88374 RepID=A0A9W6CWG6_9MICO|nr:VOC family protein [Agromyces rhizosphaerae]GLI27595.1 glyoxalase [Agromyces rhizosphaerae]
MPSPFRRLHHVCIVVRDLDATVAYYERLGVSPWFDYPKSSPYVELEVPDVEGSRAMRYKCVDLDNVQLQLCEPGPQDTPQRRFLDAQGEGVYHLGFEVDDLPAGERRGAELGLAVIARGLRTDGSGFCYFDTRADAGTVLEIRASA